MGLSLMLVSSLISSMVHVTELALQNGITRSAFLRKKIETVFKELKVKGDIVKLLQYSIALVTELNKDTNTGVKERKEKRFIRDCLLEGLLMSTVNSLERIGVISPILEGVSVSVHVKVSTC